MRSYMQSMYNFLTGSLDGEGDKDKEKIKPLSSESSYNSTSNYTRSSSHPAIIQVQQLISTILSSKQSESIRKNSQSLLISIVKKAIQESPRDISLYTGFITMIEDHLLTSSQNLPVDFIQEIESLKKYLLDEKACQEGFTGYLKTLRHEFGYKKPREIHQLDETIRHLCDDKQGKEARQNFLQLMEAVIKKIELPDNPLFSILARDFSEVLKKARNFVISKAGDKLNDPQIKDFLAQVDSTLKKDLIANPYSPPKQEDSKEKRPNRTRK